MSKFIGIINVHEYIFFLNFEWCSKVRIKLGIFHGFQQYLRMNSIDLSYKKNKKKSNFRHTNIE